MINRTGIDIIEHKNTKLISKLNLFIKKNFPETTRKYLKTDTEDYRKIIVIAQDKLNKLDIVKKTVSAIKDELFIALQTDKILVQSIAHLRATRPSIKNTGEFIQLHRESFFGSGMEKCFNVWTPIKGVSQNNSLNYVPYSHRIPLKNIKLKRKDSSFTKQYSAGHKIGLLYKDMIITKGVDINNKKPLIVNSGSSAVFECNLIHGSALNNSNEIRFSYDFRIIKKSDYKKKHFKSKNFASNSEYFVEIE